MRATHNISYCHVCVEPLFEYGEIAAYVYMGICEHYICKGYALPIDKEECARGTTEITKFLELKNYLTTTEICRNVIAARPNYHNYSNKFGHLYCCDPEIHVPKYFEGNDKEMVG